MWHAFVIETCRLVLRTPLVARKTTKKQQQKVVYCNILYISGVSSLSGQQVSVRLFISLQGGVGAYFYFHAYVVILNFLLSKFKMFATVKSTR